MQSLPRKMVMTACKHSHTFSSFRNALSHLRVIHCDGLGGLEDRNLRGWKPRGVNDVIMAIDDVEEQVAEVPRSFWRVGAALGRCDGVSWCSWCC